MMKIKLFPYLLGINSLTSLDTP